ncbi:MAG: hypothetical protein GXZ11_03930 [Tissierellia bacterium]|nr:hypothetical protein [Tissierellia bacterium]
MKNRRKNIAVSLVLILVTAAMIFSACGKTSSDNVNNEEAKPEVKVEEPTENKVEESNKEFGEFAKSLHKEIAANWDKMNKVWQG